MERNYRGSAPYVALAWRSGGRIEPGRPTWVRLVAVARLGVAARILAA